MFTYRFFLDKPQNSLNILKFTWFDLIARSLINTVTLIITEYAAYQEGHV